MYNFVDTIEHTSESVLPAEAMQFNGEYIENLIDGYRTLYAKGRDVLSPVVEVGEVGVRDGSYLKNRRFPARIITIGYQLLADTNEAFRAKYNALNDILNTTDAVLIFHDEEDKYFVGTPNGYSDVPEGRNSVTAQFEIICTDPFKYSVVEYEVTPEDGTFTVDYRGTYPAYPVLETTFYQSETPDDAGGDCGYVAFLNERENVLQFGNPVEADEIAERTQEILDEAAANAYITRSQRLLTDKFTGSNLAEWNNAGYISQPDVNKRAGSIEFGTIGTTKVLRASSYGNTSAAWHGSTACKTVGNPPAVSGASDPTRSGDFSYSFTMRYAPATAEATAKKQCGTVQAFVLDSNGNYIAGIQVWKNAGSLKGKVRAYVRGTGTVKTWDNIDLSHYNKYFGYAKAGVKPNMGVTITKKNGKITFNIGGLTCNYTNNSLANVVAQKVSFFFGKWKAEPVVTDMAIYSATFDDTAVKYTVPADLSSLTAFMNTVNVFGTNDILVADTSAGAIWLNNADEGNGTERPDLGALGNDWEQFTLEKGTNYIGTVYSEWAANAPTFKLKYRERYL